MIIQAKELNGEKMGENGVKMTKIWLREKSKPWHDLVGGRSLFMVQPNSREDLSCSFHYSRPRLANAH